MTWRLVWTRPALRDLKKLDSVIARRVRRALVTLSTTGRGDVVKLKGVRPPEWAGRQEMHRKRRKQQMPPAAGDTYYPLIALYTLTNLSFVVWPRADLRRRQVAA